VRRNHVPLSVVSGYSRGWGGGISPTCFLPKVTSITFSGTLVETAYIIARVALLPTGYAGVVAVDSHRSEAIDSL
jgi:hypothetical protein